MCCHMMSLILFMTNPFLQKCRMIHSNKYFWKSVTNCKSMITTTVPHSVSRTHLVSLCKYSIIWCAIECCPPTMSEIKPAMVQLAVL